MSLYWESQGLHQFKQRSCVSNTMFIDRDKKIVLVSTTSLSEQVCKGIARILSLKLHPTDKTHHANFSMIVIGVSDDTSTISDTNINQVTYVNAERYLSQEIQYRQQIWQQLKSCCQTWKC